jgi:hypothetical protein
MSFQRGVHGGCILEEWALKGQTIVALDVLRE